MLSGKYPNYRIRKLSQTRNANIIFSLDYIGPRRTGGFDVLEDEIHDKLPLHQ